MNSKHSKLYLDFAAPESEHSLSTYIEVELGYFPSRWNGVVVIAFLKINVIKPSKLSPCTG